MPFRACLRHWGGRALATTSLEAQGPRRGRNHEAAPAGQLDQRAARRTAAELFEFGDHLKYVKQ